jgi:hypothetical protein
VAALDEDDGADNNTLLLTKLKLSDGGLNVRPILQRTRELLEIDGGSQMLLFLAVLVLKRQNGGRSGSSPIVMCLPGGAGSTCAAFLRVLCLVHAVAKRVDPPTAAMYALPWGQYHSTVVLCAIVRKCRNFAPSQGNTTRIQMGTCREGFPLVHVPTPCGRQAAALIGKKCAAVATVVLLLLLMLLFI